jgi:hypothetical protein
VTQACPLHQTGQACHGTDEAGDEATREMVRGRECMANHSPGRSDVRPRPPLSLTRRNDSACRPPCSPETHHRVALHCVAAAEVHQPAPPTGGPCQCRQRTMAVCCCSFAHTVLRENAPSAQQLLLSLSSSSPVTCADLNSAARALSPQAPLETSTGCRGQGSPSSPLLPAPSRISADRSSVLPLDDSYGERFLLPSSHAARFTVCLP